MCLSIALTVSWFILLCVCELLLALAGRCPCVVRFCVVREAGGLPAKSVDNLVKSILLPLAAHGLFPFPGGVILKAFSGSVRGSNLVP